MELRDYAAQALAWSRWGTQQLEGPYRWYIIATAIFLLTAFVSRFIFKTFKWFLFLLVIGAVFIGMFYLLATWAEIY